jgi:hypothetical protein
MILIQLKHVDFLGCKKCCVLADCFGDMSIVAIFRVVYCYRLHTVTFVIDFLTSVVHNFYCVTSTITKQPILGLEVGS